MEPTESALQSLERHLEVFSAIINHLFAECLVQEAPDEQLTVSQMKCLRFVLLNEVVSIGDIAKGLNVSYPAATKAVSRLEEKKLVARHADPTDRRSILVRITKKGRELLLRISPAKTRCLREVIVRLPQEKVNSLETGIRGFLCAAAQEPKVIEQLCLHCGSQHHQDCIIAQLKEVCPHSS